MGGLGCLEVPHLPPQLLHLCLEPKSGLVGHVSCEESHKRAVKRAMVAEFVLQIGTHAVLGLKSHPREPSCRRSVLRDVDIGRVPTKLVYVVTDLNHLVGQKKKNVLG